MNTRTVCAHLVPPDERRSLLPLDMPGSAGPRSPGGRLILLVVAAMVLIAHSAAADTWYEHYSKADKALVDQDWTLAVQEINQALEKKGDSGARVRTYGMNVTAYFPYLKLGVAYYNLDQFDAALQAFETEARLGAIAQSETANAELERYRGLVQEARVIAVAEEQQRIRQIVEQRFGDARDLEGRGLLDEAMAALDQVLAVAPDNADAQSAMSQLRQRLAERTREQERDQRASSLVEEGRTRLRERQYSEASSLFR
ncbi:MAG: tetratricopeptide repeat protein, partial [Planctomycetota bacterium]